MQTTALQELLESKKIPTNVEKAQIPLLMNAGDTVFMHPRLIHGSWLNTSQQSPRLFINGFSSPGANHRPYPGKGSGKRISLITGEELTVATAPAVKIQQPIATSPIEKQYQPEDDVQRKLALTAALQAVGLFPTSNEKAIANLVIDYDKETPSYTRS